MKDFQSKIQRIKSLSKKYLNFQTLFIIPSFFLASLIVLILLDFLLRQVSPPDISLNPFLNFAPADYPLIPSPQIVNENINTNIAASAAIVVDADSHAILYAKNEHLRLSPASTAKVMTAIVALNAYKPTDILTVKKIIDTQGSGLGLFIGEQMTFENLLAGALIPSANDAAVTIAQNYPGGEEAFISAMNKMAAKLHLYDTHFSDPDGLFDDEDFSSPIDLVRLAQAAMKNPLFSKIVDTKNMVISSLDGRNNYSIKNRNILLGYYGINGIKTGYTDEAGEVLITSSTQDNHTIYTVVMGSKDRFADTATILGDVWPNTTFVSMRP